MDLIYSKPLNDGSGKTYCEYAGNSSETQPVFDTLASGSKIHEVDTAIIQAYDAATQTWYPQIELGGGS